MRKLKAYSLMELSVVLVIISSLAAGAIVVSVNNMNHERVNITKDRMNVIYQRLRAYIKQNKALPCPAILTRVKSVDADYATSGNCTAVTPGVYVNGTLVYGAVPTTTLGLSYEFAEDGFGNKIFYFVDSSATSAAAISSTTPPNFTQTNFSTTLARQFSTTPQTLISILENSTGAQTTLTDFAVMGMLSAGSNKYGAYPANSSTASSSSGADNDELTNITGDSFVYSASAGTTFDDIVMYKTSKDLVTELELMELVPCPNTDSNFGSVTGGAWYEGILYGPKLASSCSSNPNARFSKRCDAFSTWVNIATSTSSACPSAGADTCTLTQNTNQGSGAYYTAATYTYEAGVTIPLTCRSGYGRAIIGGSSTSTDSTKTCGRTTTDRSNNDPIGYCSGGVVQVIDDCSACRACNQNSLRMGDANTNYHAEKSCNGFSWYANELWPYCTDNSFSAPHNNPRHVGVVRERKCKVQGVCGGNERNECLAFFLTCIDGTWNVHYGYDANIGSESATCGSSIVTCRNYSVADNC